jgi:dihydrofolate synthase/folylpolyglutamate synthase
LGEHQVVNAAVAVTAIDVASACWKPIGIEHVQSGLRAVEWLGRLEIARRDPPLIFDCAHNADSAEKLAVSLADLFPGLRWTLVFGASVDKDIAAMLDALLPHVDRLIVTQSDSVRASQADQIAQMAMERKRPVETTSSVKEAVERAIDTGAPVIITGSIFVVAEAREAWFEHIGAPVPERDS